MNNTRRRADAKDAKKVATRRAMETQYALPARALEPEVFPVLRDREVSPLPGYYKRGGLRGVTYTSHIGRAYVS